ncbi:MAG: hypothetical protein ACOYB3_00090 [Azonexus sp.]
MSTATYISTERYAAIADIPVCLPETALRRGNVVQIASFKLETGQRAVVRLIDLNIVKVLTPGIVPDIINSSFGWCYAGVFAGYMAASPFITVATSQVGISGLHSCCEKIIASPGIYTVKVVNNTGKTAESAIDLAVVVTGVIKIYA